MTAYSLHLIINLFTINTGKQSSSETYANFLLAMLFVFACIRSINT